MNSKRCYIFLPSTYSPSVEVTALTCRINNNNNIYRLSGPSEHPAGRQKVEWAITQYRTCNTWNMTEANRCIYALICLFTGLATKNWAWNGFGHLWIMERPNVHIISLQLIIHYAGENWLIATETYNRIPMPSYKYRTILSENTSTFHKEKKTKTPNSWSSL